MPSAKLNLLWRVLLLVVIFAGFEFSVGHLSHSLALQADSGHMMADGGALAIALCATWMAQTLERTSTATAQPQTNTTLEVGAALINGLGLMGMAGLIGWEAYCHWQSPPTEILSGPMLATAVIGLVVNGISMRWLHTTDTTEVQGQDLNVQGVFLHVLADIISSIGVILAAIVVWIWGWVWVDNVISIGVAILIASSAVPLVRQSLKALRSPAQTAPLVVGSIPSEASPLNTVGLNTVGFYEVGQTDLSTMILGTESSRSQNADNQP